MIKVITRGYTDSSLGQVHYRTARDSRLPALVLIHQSPSSSIMYEALMLRLAEKFYIVAPDTPGFGGSDPLPHAATIEAYSVSIVEALKNIGLKKCFCFGITVVLPSRLISQQIIKDLSHD